MFLGPVNGIHSLDDSFWKKVWKKYPQAEKRDSERLAGC
jgi:hypothetical protein